jgi:DNA-binding NtrC family response regulator
MTRVLVVEPDAALTRDLLRVIRAAGFAAEAAGSLADALAALALGGFDAVLLDVSRDAGLAAVDTLRSRAPGVAVIAVGADPAVERVVEAIRRGASDFLRKPFSLASLERAIGALESARLEARAGGAFLTEDAAVLRLLEDLRKAAATEATIRIVGESGTGKELLARIVHEASRRRSGPQVLVNCGGLQASLAESELFGHDRGAFTGAVESRPGQIAAAHGGTLVLDEVADLAPELQPKLLRVIQEREVTPLGTTRPRSVDLRIVATTQRDLAAEVAAGRFREDLYYRLDVISFRVPPLRERPADVPLLARAFLERFARGAGVDPPRLDDRALEALMQLPFRGNVRELENLMRRAAVLFPGREVDVARLRAPGSASPQPLPEGLRCLNLRSLERAAIERSLRESRGNRTLASRALGINVRTLRNKIRLYGLA